VPQNRYFSRQTIRMKRLTFFVAPLLLFACTTEATPAAEPEKPAKAPDRLDLVIDDPNWNDWLSYYRSKTADFGPQQFLLQDSGRMEQLTGNVKGSFDPGFDPAYEPFLIWSPDKTKYIDLDSYSWEFKDGKVRPFGPDQEIDLVDVEKRTIRRIAFRGPSQTVENAAWRDNQTVLLLENSPDSGPSVTLIDLRNGKTYNYSYDGKFRSRSGYSDHRFEKLLGNRIVSEKK
jgi:hypothetical protein